MTLPSKILVMVVSTQCVWLKSLDIAEDGTCGSTSLTCCTILASLVFGLVLLGGWLEGVLPFGADLGSWDWGFAWTASRSFTSWAVKPVGISPEELAMCFCTSLEMSSALDFTGGRNLILYSVYGTNKDHDKSCHQPLPKTWGGIGTGRGRLTLINAGNIVLLNWKHHGLNFRRPLLPLVICSSGNPKRGKSGPKQKKKNSAETEEIRFKLMPL